MGKLATSQANLIALLQADDFFVDRSDPSNPVDRVPVISKRDGDFVAVIDEKIGSLGVCLVVIIVGAKLLDAGSQDLTSRVQFALSAIENPIGKDDGAPTSEDIVEKAMQLLHWQPNGTSPHDESDEARFQVSADAIDPLLPPKKQAGLNIQVLTVTTALDLNPAA